MTKTQIKKQVEEDCSTAYGGAVIAKRIWSISSVRKALTEAADNPDLDDEDCCGLVMTAVGAAVFHEANRTRDGKLLETVKEIPNNAVQATPMSFYDRLISYNLFQEEDKVSPEGLAAGKAMGTYLAWHLERDGFVKQFREQALQGRLFAGDYHGIDAAWHFITSPLVKLLSFNDFQKMNLCPKDATGRVLLDDDNFYSKAVSQAPHMQGYVTRSENRMDQMGKEEHCLDFQVEVDQADGSQRCLTVSHESQSYKCIGYPPYSSARPDSPSVQEVETAFATEPEVVPWLDGRIRVTKPGEKWRQPERPFVEGYGLSVANECLGILNYLSASYPVEIWKLLRFILTGTGFFMPPIFSSAFDYDPTLYIRSVQDKDDFESITPFSARGPITLHVQPWVQADELAQYWRQCRFRYDAGRTSPKAANLEIFRFVLQHTPPGEPFQWQQLTDLWNKETNQIKTRASIRNAFLKTRDDLFPSFSVGQSLKET